MGITPIIWNKFALSIDKYPVYIKPILLLDSNVMSAVHDFVTNKINMSKDRYESVNLLIKFIIKMKYDITGAFYCLEAIYKSNVNRKFYILECLKTIFTLQTIDENIFEETGEIKSNPKKVKEELDFHNVDTLEKQSELIYKSFEKAYLNQEIDILLNITYVSLLKISIINYKNKPPFDKYLETFTFFKDDLGIIGANELTFALLYYYNTDNYKKFLPPLQKRLNFDNLINKINSSTWDLLLLRLPPLFIDSEKDINYEKSAIVIKHFICTAENALKDLFSVQKIETIFSLKEYKYGKKILTSLNFDNLSKFIPEIDIDKLKKLEVDESRLIYNCNENNTLENKIKIYKHEFEKEIIEIIKI